MYKFYQIVVTLYSWMLFISLWIFSTLMAVILTLHTKDKENIFNSIERVFSRIAFKLLGMKIEIQGLENIPRGRASHLYLKPSKYDGYQTFSRLYTHKH